MSSSHQLASPLGMLMYSMSPLYSDVSTSPSVKLPPGRSDSSALVSVSSLLTRSCQ